VINAGFSIHPYVPTGSGCSDLGLRNGWHNSACRTGSRGPRCPGRWRLGCLGRTFFGHPAGPCGRRDFGAGDTGFSRLFRFRPGFLLCLSCGSGDLFRVGSRRCLRDQSHCSDANRNESEDSHSSASQNV
jgi:hypothetical protein